MPPFQSRRFDPYDDSSPPNSNSSSHRPSTLRRQHHRQTALHHPSQTTARAANIPHHRHSTYYESQPRKRYDAIGQILANIDDHPRDESSSRPHRDEYRTGASKLTSQLHPLASRHYYKDKPLRYHPSEDSPAHLLNQARRILSILLGHDDKLLLPPQTESELFLHLLSSKSTLRLLRLFLLLPLLLYAVKKYVPPYLDKLTRPTQWKWSAGVSLPGHTVPPRNLSGRNCVMNYFIEKQPPDEYDPDFKELKPNELPKPVEIVQGSYRTKGQVHVISRFIEAVADSFRSNTAIRQHLIFTEVRDSGHLAYEAIRHWPPRGKHRTVVHVVAADDQDVQARDLALGYGTLEDIEVRFRGNDRARIYDREGNLAGLVEEEGVDDDETLKEMMEMEVPDGETLELRRRSGRKHSLGVVNSTLLSDGSSYPDLRLMLPFEEEDEDGEVVVPYLHVDGVSMVHQMRVLEAARSLLLDKTVVVVGIEHAPDLNVRELIAFFREVQYKTFFLGARQIARIDNLCEEVLDDVLDHPSVSPPKPSFVRRVLMKIGLISKDELRIAPKASAGALSSQKRETPPFFVAMPRGRKNREEMTIQHMYDLFGGYGGGGGQIKTANDRKAPGK